MVINPASTSRESRDVFSNNLKNGIIYMVGEITDEVAASIIAQLFDAQQNLDSLTGTDKAIRLYINSPGGSVSAGLSIYDTIQSLHVPVHTICMGMAASMAAVILAGGKERFILPHGEVMIHQPSGETMGKATDILIAANHIKERRQELNKILSARTGKSLEVIARDTETDTWLDANHAVEYGIVDHIINAA